MTSTEHNLIIAGSKHKVSILRTTNDHSFRVEYDGIPFEIFLSGEKSGLTLAVIDGLPIIVGKSTSTPPDHTLCLNEKEIRVSFSQTSIPKGVQSKHIPPESSRPSPLLQKGVGRVIAHMPGRVVSVKVKPSDRVKVGDPMFVILAMKMENTLVAPTGGVVAEVCVQTGGSVNKGDLLALIE